MSGAGKSADKDVAEDRSELDETTPAFVELFMKKVERLEKTQFEKGKSGCPEKQCQKGERGSKATQWGSPWGTGSFGVKGSQQTYDSMTALAKAIGKHQSGMSRAWRAAMETAPSSELRVFFRYAGLELVFYKEVDSGKN